MISRLIQLLFFFMASVSYADPWFTGSLLSGSATVVPLGEVALSLGVQDFRNPGLYNANYVFVSTPRYSADHFEPLVTYGLSSDVDFQLSLDYVKNQNEGQSYSNLGDTTMQLGFQLLTQGNSNIRSDIRIVLQERFPTGHYNNLDPKLYTTDATGSGSYGSSVGINIEHLVEFANNHYVNLSGAFLLTLPSIVHLQGLSAYGGSTQTVGYVRPGSSVTIDMAMEYSITQNWVAVMESFLYVQQATSFNGTVADDFEAFLLQRYQDAHASPRHPIFNRIMPSLLNIGGSGGIGSGNAAEITLSPALEYNFSANMGLIGGCWFTLSGKNVPTFITTMLTLSVSW